VTGNRPGKPLLNAKLLVLGRFGWVEYDYDVGTEERWEFEPCSVWWASANRSRPGRAGGADWVRAGPAMGPVEGWAVAW
jgi:hypothetical protein